MRRRRLGTSALEVPVIVFGAWAVGGWAWGGRDDASDRAAVDAMRAGIALGMTAIDTAPVYGFGHSERLVGRAIEGLRDRVQILTKAGLTWDDPRGVLAFEDVDERGAPRKVYRNSRPDSVRRELDASLARLGVEHVDLLQIHWPDPTTPIPETMGALQDLVREGKVRAVGVSNYSVEQLEIARLALGDVPLASDQPRYSLVRREIEADVLPWAQEHGVGLLAYSPLEQGLLTGAVGPEREFPPGDFRAARPTFRRENRAKVAAALARSVLPIARERNATPAQVVLAWTVQVPGVTAAIAGARTPRQVEENAFAGALELTERERAAIDAAFARLGLDLDPAS